MAEHNHGGQGTADAPNSPYSNSHAGRPKSWLAVTVMVIGFCVAGVAMCFGPDWTFVWIGTAVIVVGGILALFADIWNDVVVDPPRVSPEEAAALAQAQEAKQAELAGKAGH